MMDSVKHNTFVKATSVYINPVWFRILVSIPKKFKFMVPDEFAQLYK
jgi:hypothetical protein